MRYNEQYKILFRWNPMAQATIGRFFGYMLVTEVHANSRLYQEGDQVLFTMSSGSQWDKLVKFIQTSF